MQKRDLHTYIGVFLIIAGILPLFSVDFGRLSAIVNVLVAVSGLLVLITR